MADKYAPTIKDPIKVYSRKWNTDARGSLVEILRFNDEPFVSIMDFGQVYVTTIRPGITKAWHMHKYQTDSMFLIKGIVHFGVIKPLELGSPSSTTYLSLVVSDQDPKLILIPPTYYHGFKNIGNEDAYIINVPNEEYNIESPDELREPYNSVMNPNGFWNFDYNG